MVLEGVNRRVWENAWSEFTLDLHLMSYGAALAVLHAWLLNVRSIVFCGRPLPDFLRYIHTTYNNSSSIMFLNMLYIFIFLMKYKISTS